MYYSRSLSATETVAARGNRCLALLKLKRFAEAESDANVVLAKEPKNVKAWLRRGWARKELGRFQDAAADLKHCLELEVGQHRGAEACC